MPNSTLQLHNIRTGGLGTRKFTTERWGEKKGKEKYMLLETSQGLILGGRGKEKYISCRRDETWRPDLYSESGTGTSGCRVS